MSTPPKDKPWKAKKIDCVSRSIHSGPDTLGSCPEVSRRIGHIITLWSGIERLMVDIYAYVVDAEEWLAAELLQEVRKLEPRRALFLQAFRAKFGQQSAESIRVMMKDFKELQSERDDLAHGVFQVINEDFTSVVRVEGWGDKQEWYLYDLPTLDALVARFQAAANNMMLLRANVTLAVPPRYEAGRLIPAFGQGPSSENLPSSGDKDDGRRGQNSPGQTGGEETPPKSRS